MDVVRTAAVAVRTGSRSSRRLVVGGVVALTAAAVIVSACSGDESPSVSVGVVAGGGDDPRGVTAEGVQLKGRVSDLAVHEGTVHAVVYDGDHDLVTVEADGSVTRMPVDVAGGVDYVAVGPDGTVYVSGSEVIYRVDGDVLVPEVVLAGSDQEGDGDVTVSSPGTSINGVAVGGDGRLVWTNAFIGAGPDEGSEPVMTKVYRLNGAEVDHIAGAGSLDVEPQELDELAASPPSDVKAVDFPLRHHGSRGGLTAGDDGSAYLGGTSTILNIEPGGGVEAVVSGDDPAFLEEPFGDQRDASHLYVAGQASTSSGPESEALIVSTPISEEWQ